MKNNDILTALMNFDGTIYPEFDALDIDLHDNHFLPPGCKRYDEWADCTDDELLGVYD